MSAKRVLLAIISLLLIASTSFAPLPEYLAINYETKQCGRYWPGDEFVNYDLPSGWNSYAYQSSDGYVSVETAIGTCKVPTMQTSLAQACCTQLGYTYVSDNVGILHLTPENLANQKAVQDIVAQENAQARANRIQSIGLYTIVSLAMILFVMAFVRWLVRNRKR